MSLATYPQLTLAELDEPIWEQQTRLGEHTVIYAQFVAYRSMRPVERNYSSGWRMWTKGTDQEGGQISTTYQTTARNFLWNERAAAYDIYKLQDRYREWGQRDWMWRDDVWEAGSKLHERATKALETADTKNMSLLEIAQLMKIANELRVAAIPSLGTLNTMQIREVLSALPDAKREHVIRIVMAEIRQSGSDTTLLESKAPAQLADTSEIIDAELVTMPEPAPEPALESVFGPAPKKVKKPEASQELFADYALQMPAEGERVRLEHRRSKKSKQTAQVSESLAR